ncbi:TfoX/Sxy family protein [Paracoccus aurantiacus]|uniref:TfoX/Sxy family protein n=1 Tax=Paracoccus aurantiacus TaxID=2599412 RepID=A0A5C6S2R9_9RHOB|nr:TfoX/Sxy family protein [Paracoccus aurantiacus]TXB68229.1 TfoX/Sxy family protein [Paracoccus aurantiacus]
MGTTKEQAAAIVAKLTPAGEVVARPMFGDYGIYLDGVIFGVICDGQLFIKPTDAARAVLRNPAEGIPYHNARPHLRIEPEDLDDPGHMARILSLTVANLPKKAGKKR